MVLAKYLLVRSAAVATVVGMLSVSAPALAQQQQQPTQQQQQTQQGTSGHPVTESNEGTNGNTGAQPAPEGFANGGMDPAQCTTGTLPTDQNNSTTNTQGTTGTTTSSNGASSGTLPNAQTQGAGTHCPTTSTRPVPGSPNTGAPGMTPSTTTGGGTVTPGATTPMNNSSSTTSTTNTGVETNGAPTAGSGMTDTLRDNPNGSNWLQKFNRPNVASSNHRSRYRTHKMGTTTPPQ